MDAVTRVPAPINEPVLDYAPGSPERAELEVALAELGGRPMELPHTIGGKRVTGTGKKIDVRQPHAHKRVLGTMREASVAEAEAAVAAATAAAPAWRALSFDDRAAVLRPSCSRQPTCSPGRGGQGSSPQRCWASQRRATRPRSTRPAS